MKAIDVFTPGKQPNITFIEDKLTERKEILLDALAMGAVIVSLSGPSKSGKTVFVEKTIGKERLIQVTGAGIDNPNKLWDRVFDLIGVPVIRKRTDQNGFTSGLTGKISAGARFLVGAAVEAGTSGSWSDNTSETLEYSPDYLQLLIKELSQTEYVIFIDDFHYITKSAQIEIANQIKEATRAGVQFICAAVPYHSDDFIRANPDLRGRMVKLDFDYWDEVELRKIADLGFTALNINLSTATIEALASEAAGSPQLMQALCLNICFEEKVRERRAHLTMIKTTLGLIERVCQRTAIMTDYSSTVEKLRDGPRSGNRDVKHYLSNGNKVCDVYALILAAISVNPPELTIRYQNLNKRLGSICQGEPPSMSSIAAACIHLTGVANDAENKVVMEWDTANDVLDIRDPYFLFYLRWVASIA
jgi:hypothetical protein